MRMCEWVSVALATLLLMCDPRDLGVSITEDINSGLMAFEPNLYLFDNYPGGIGLSGPLFQMTSRLLAGARELLAGCPCEAGCPSCVGPLGEVGERGKEGAARMLAVCSSLHPSHVLAEILAGLGVKVLSAVRKPRISSSAAARPSGDQSGRR